VTLLLDVAAPALLIAIPVIILLIVIGIIGVGVYFIVRAVKKKNEHKENGR
jgi:heme/copper-type cytochrome/quinol oxidase subunit 2